MRKLVLIAAMLMLPAIALADTDVTWSEVVVNTGLEEFAYGPIHMQSDSNGHIWGNWGGGVNIIDDPTGAGRGKVAAWQTVTEDPLPFKERLYVDRTDHDWVITHSLGGQVTFMTDMFLFTNLGDFTNVAFCEAGVSGHFYLDGGTITPGDTVEGWAASDPWFWPSQYLDPGFQTHGCGPLPLDQCWSLTSGRSRSTSTSTA